MNDGELALDEPIQPIPRGVPIDAPRASLGRALFTSTILTDDGRVSCASCHSPEHGMADGRAGSQAPERPLTPTNATSLYNLRFFSALGWTGRFADVGEHLDGLIANPRIMGSSWSGVVARLGRDPTWVARFEAVFGDGPRADNARAALVQYERSLVTPGAPFDRWLLGDAAAIPPEAARGYALFKDYGCVSCHQGVAVGANLFQRLGVMRDRFAGRAEREVDRGRYDVTGDEEDRQVFRVPSLRNVARTGPYLHDGSVPSLPAAIELMADLQLGIALEARDVSALTAFLVSLTGDPSGGGT